MTHVERSLTKEDYRALRALPPPRPQGVAHLVLLGIQNLEARGRWEKRDLKLLETLVLALRHARLTEGL